MSMTLKMKGVLWTTAAVAAMAFQASVAVAGEIIWWTPNWGEPRAKELAAKFEAANPGIKIKMEITVSDGLPTKILTALQSGSAPDLIEAQHGWVVPYAQSNLILPLDDILKDKADYVPAALDYDTWNGKLWGIPYRIETHAIIYNKAAFKAAGLDPEKQLETWPQLVEAAKKLTGKNAAGQDQYGFAITGGGEFGNTVFRSLPFVWMAGGSIISDDMKKVTVNEKGSVEGVKFYTDFLANKLSPPSTLQNDGAANRRLFITGNVAMYQSGQFDVPAIKQENPKLDIGVMMIPHPEGKSGSAAILGGWSFVIPKGAKNPEETKKFVQFLAESNNMGFFTDTFPARTSAFAMDRFKDPILTVFKNMLPYGHTLPPHKNWIQITQKYFDGLQEIMTGSAKPQEAMDEAAKEIADLIK
jgi:ABC-type glycerol-3-phosphate transport system substrate-binding protein